MITKTDIIEVVAGGRPPPWSPEENEIVVDSYLMMLAKDMAGEKYVKRAQYLKILPNLDSCRTEWSVYRKHCNITAILQALGEPWIKGHYPQSNYQHSLVEVVIRQVEKKREFFANASAKRQESRGIGFQEIVMCEPDAGVDITNMTPTKKRQALMDQERMDMTAQKYDVAGRDEFNRALGQGGERLVMENEACRLRNVGRFDLADKIEWSSQKRGDGLGYDIVSFDFDGKRRFIEVKTTNGYSRTPFYVSANEKKVSQEMVKDGQNWVLFRLFEFNTDPKAFVLTPAELETFSWATNSYKVRPKSIQEIEIQEIDGSAT